jgi:hypothetical protein
VPFNYTTVAAVKATLAITSSADDQLIADAVTAACAAVNTYCHRQFEPVTQTRYYGQYYDRMRGSILYLDDDLLSLTTLTNAEASVIPNTGYWLEPRNVPPYGAIRLKTSYTWTFNTDGEIAVAGTWGYSSSCPEDIARATLRWAIYLYRQKDTPDFEVTATPDGGQQVIPHGIPADIKPLLTPYRRVQI